MASIPGATMDGLRELGEFMQMPRACDAFEIKDSLEPGGAIRYADGASMHARRTNVGRRYTEAGSVRTSV
jgi:hypothetical protein